MSICDFKELPSNFTYNLVLMYSNTGAGLLFYSAEGFTLVSNSFDFQVVTLLVLALVLKYLWAG